MHRLCGGRARLAAGTAGSVTGSPSMNAQTVYPGRVLEERTGHGPRRLPEDWLDLDFRPDLTLSLVYVSLCPVPDASIIRVMD